MSDWKDKRIEAINRVVERKNLTCSPDSPYFDEVIDIYNSEATSLKEFKLSTCQMCHLNFFISLFFLIKL